MEVLPVPNRFVYEIRANDYNEQNSDESEVSLVVKGTIEEFNCLL